MPKVPVGSPSPVTSRLDHVGSRGSGRALAAVLTFTSNIGSTCDLGIQKVALTPGASSTCGGGNCSCSSCCCW